MIIDNQFRPTPQSRLLPPVLDAIEAAGKPAVVVCANGKVFPMSDSDIDQKIGKDNLARMERLGIEFHQNDPRNTDNYEYVGVSSRGTPVWLHKEVAACDVKITIGQAQSNHWGAGGGGKLILPGVVSDETIESNHCAFVPSPQTHYGAYAGPMRSDIDEVATMCGLSATMNVVLDTHGRVIECMFGSHPDAHRKAIERFNEIYAYEHPGTQADIAICGVFAPTDHLFFHTGWGCMSADFVVKDGGTIIYCSPSPGVSTAIGDFPGLALMDLMKPYMPATPENYQSVLKDIHARAIQMWAGCIWVPIYEVMTRKHLVARHARWRTSRWPPTSGSTRRRRSTGRSRPRWSDTGRTRRSSSCRTRATSCLRTWCGWTRRRCGIPRRRWRTDAASGSRARRARDVGGGPGVAGDQRLDDDRRAAADVPRRGGDAAALAAHDAVRALRRGLPRAADDGREAPSARSAIGHRCLSRTRRRRP